MTDLLLLALLVVAIGIGWFLGRNNFSANTTWFGRGPSMPSQYYRGLNFLLDGSQDSAIDAFTKALEVNTETFDTHIALGNVLRRRGEVERAIRIHQNLLARPSLPDVQLHMAHLELARDYISAGLLDRSERLLLDLVAESGNHRRIAQRHLLEIYEAQRDWMSAKKVAEQLLPKRSLLRGSGPETQEVGQPVNVLLAQYCCELALESQQRGDSTAAKSLLEQALGHDKQCVRATMMVGELELKAGQPQRALKALKAIANQNPDFVPETTTLLRDAYQALDKRDELKDFLVRCFDNYPSTRLVLDIALELRDREGPPAAKQFLRDTLTERPSLRGLALLMKLHSREESGEDEALELDIVDRLIAARASYRCNHCGFRGQHMHWYCPGCKHWGTLRDRDIGSSGDMARG